jgi:low temperature requirement protein LtrA
MIARMTEPAPSPVAEGRRVDWMELFFDLAFVAFVTQLAHGLHGAPAPTDFLIFIAWSVPAWWAWVNIMACVNVLPVLPPRMIGVALLGAMATIGLMATSVTETADRAWAFSLANGVLRVILLVVWLCRAKSAGHPLASTFVYNGLTALLWLASALLPAPFDFILWGVAILTEVLLLRLRYRTLGALVRVDTAHASERLGLFMIILMGESVLSLVTSLAAHWSVLSGIAALIGFVAIAFVAWGFFVVGSGIIESGLARLNELRAVSALLDTVMFMPYLIVVGITMFAAGLATAISEPGDPLPVGAAVCLGGGLALFYLSNAVVVLRYGTPWREVLPWTIPGIVLPVVILTAAASLPAIVSLAGVALVVVGIVVFSTASQRRRSAAV